MASKIGIGGSGVSAKQIRSWLVTALFVFVALDILLAVIRPFLGLIMVGIVVITVANILFRRH